MNRRPDKVLSLLGLSMKSGNVVSGEVAVENAVKSGKAWLVIIPLDASENTVKKFLNMCKYREIPCYRYSSKELLGHAMGKEERSSAAVVDRGFAQTIQKYLDAVNDANGGDCEQWQK